MLGVISEDSNHNKIFKPMAGATLGQGVPLGAWCSFEADVAPSSNWLRAGTTFDSNTYPALALYLGSNTVPSRYDHDRPSEWEEVASTNTFTPAYDGFMAVSYYNSGVIIKVNDVQIDIDNSPSNANGNMTLPFKKGDVIKFFNVYDGSARAIAFKVRYYTHPLFIKATSIASDSDKDSILAQIQAFNTYSTEETLTGKTVIVDGVEKPVYRKCYENLSVNLTVGNWIDIVSLDANFLRLENCDLFSIDGSGRYCKIPILVGTSTDKTKLQFFNVSAVSYGGTINRVVLEYTKTV